MYGIYFSHQKGNTAIWDNLGETWGHYAKLNKLETDKYDMLSFIWGI